MILPSIEDESRYTAPPEPTEEHHEEPEDHIDWLGDNFPDCQFLSHNDQGEARADSTTSPQDQTL